MSKVYVCALAVGLVALTLPPVAGDTVTGLGLQEMSVQASIPKYINVNWSDTSIDFGDLDVDAGGGGWVESGSDVLRVDITTNTELQAIINHGRDLDNKIGGGGYKLDLEFEMAVLGEFNDGDLPPGDWETGDGGWYMWGKEGSGCGGDGANNTGGQGRAGDMTILVKGGQVFWAQVRARLWRQPGYEDASGTYIQRASDVLRVTLSEA